MFVASSLYNYATGSTKPDNTTTPTNTRLKRQSVRRRAGNNVPTSPPPSYASVASGQSPVEAANSIEEQLATDESQRLRTAADLAKIAVIDSIVKQEDLYEVLGVKRNAKSDEIRRGFLNRSRVCHPDKFPSYAPCVVAFQRVSFAYQTLSKPSSRRLYDVSGRSDLAAAFNENPGGANGAGLGGDETLNSVLYSVFCEFLDGDFQMIRVLVNALNESNPGLNLGEDAVDSIEGAFAKLREIMMAGKKYLTIIRFELIRLYEIQHSLRQLSYFDVFGRLRLTLQLARVTLSIPMAIDQAMKEPEGAENGNGSSKDHTEEKMRDVDDDAADHDGGNSEDGEEDDDDDVGEAEFGMRAENEDDNSDDDSRFNVESRAKTNRHRRKNTKRSRVEAARRARIKEQEELALQRKGLLGPTAASLLKGVVKVLETSEGWVPGQKKMDDDG